jgi:predicted HAD superfamily Cof-like phosphohydrolase
MNDSWEKVKRFHEVFGHPVSKHPSMVEKYRVEKRAAWMREEIQEFVDSHDVTEQSDAMIDLIYFALGTLVEMGVKPQNLFDIVQEANMSKVWLDGKVRYRDDGKVMKPPGWKDPGPLLVLEIENQINKSAFEQFEEIAHAFWCNTGKYAPGKDPGQFGKTATFDEWENWRATNGHESNG